MESREAVCHSDLFRDVAPGQTDRLLGSVAHSYQKFCRHDVVALAGKSYDTLLIVLSGEIAAQLGCAAGRYFVPSLLGPYTAIFPSLLFGRASLPVTLVAVRPTNVLCLPRQSVLTLCRQSEEFLLALLRDAGEKFTTLTRNLWMLYFASLRQRTAAYLLDLAEQQGCDCVELPCSKTALAEMLMAERPSLSRVLSELVRLRCIEVDGRTVKLLAKRELEDMLPR